VELTDTTAQLLARVRDLAAATAGTDCTRLTAVVPGIDSAALAELLQSTSRLTLNFHPDRLSPLGHSVAEGFLQLGRYLPQSVTGLSSGSRSAIPGGERFRWEDAFFGLTADSSRDDRPVYGTLDVTNDPFGGGPRFGSCFIVLHEDCLERTTFCVGDSHLNPQDVGTSDQFAGILAGFFEMVDATGLARNLTVPDLLAGLDSGFSDEPARDLDHYIEAQIHGPVDFERDVVAIVADPSFRGTPTETALQACGERWGLDIRWHPGSVLAVDDVPNDFRGPTMQSLAQTVAKGGLLTAAAIGRALTDVAIPPPMADGDPPESPLQQHKYLWHCLLRFGREHATT